MASDSEEPVLPVCLSALEDDGVSLSADDDFGLKSFSCALLASLETSPVLNFRPIVRRRLWIFS